MKCPKCDGTGTITSEYKRIRHLLNLPISREQDAACLYLESKGLRFCVDFGYENAFDKAFDQMESEQMQ